jgi:hypothetical protein
MRAHFARSRLRVFTTCYLTVASLLVFSELSAAKCPVTLTKLVGQKTNQQIKASIEAAAKDFQPAGNVAPEEMARTASETLPLLRRADFLNPVWPGARIYLDAYYGNAFASSSPDYQIFPTDESFLCNLSVGRAVFLSDGQTHHYAVVYDINYQTSTITLLDPWASVSFLLPGNNLANVKAKARFSKARQPLLDLSFAEFQRVVLGSVEEFNPVAALALAEALHPEYQNNEDFLFWKYSRLMATSSWQRTFIPTLELSARKDLQSKPRLDLLARWAHDYLTGVQSRFSIPQPGKSSAASEINRLREAYFERLPRYAEQLPWTQKWLLLNRAEKSEDTELYGATLRRFLETSPDDIDFLIRQASFFIENSHWDEAETAIERAKIGWKNEVAKTISLPTPSDAIKFLFSKDYGLQTLAVLHWRNVRVQFLERELKLAKAGISGEAAKMKMDHELAMEHLQSQYVISSLLLDFFPEVLKDAFLAQDHDAIERYIQTVIGLPDDKRRSQIFALTLYRHFTTTESIATLSSPTGAMLRRSAVGTSLCSLSQIYKPREFNPLTRAFVRFCWARAIALQGRWTLGAADTCASRGFNIHITDDAMLEVTDANGNKRTEWIIDSGRTIDNHSLVRTRLQSSKFASGPFAFSSKDQPTYVMAEPEEGFPVALKASQFNMGPFESREQFKFYIAVDDNRTAFRDSPSLSGKGGVTLLRCPSDSASRTDEAEKATTALPVEAAVPSNSSDPISKRAIEVGAESSRRRAYCGSFFAYSVDSNLPDGYVIIKGSSGSGPLN